MWREPHPLSHNGAGVCTSHGWDARVSLSRALAGPTACGASVVWYCARCRVRCAFAPLPRVRSWELRAMRVGIRCSGQASGGVLESGVAVSVCVCLSVRCAGKPERGRSLCLRPLERHLTHHTQLSGAKGGSCCSSWLFLSDVHYNYNRGAGVFFWAGGRGGATGPRRLTRAAFGHPLTGVWMAPTRVGPREEL